MRMRIVVLLAIIAVLATACGGSSRSPLMAEGRDLYTGKGCSACHGGSGEGGTGPALAGVAETFPRCDDQVEWVRLGAQRWGEEHGDTYGATAKPNSGVMPSFEEAMTDAERRTVVAYERVELGELDENAVRIDCGI